MTLLARHRQHGVEHDPHDETAGAVTQAVPLAHHFDTPQQQFTAAKLGMWLFLATELLLFGGLFCAYAVYRHNKPEIFDYGSRFLDVTYGATNTIILILSSLTMAMAVTAAQLGRKRLLVILLSLSLLGGALFMGIKYIEYRHKFHENLVWGAGFYETPVGHEGAATHEDESAAVANAEASGGDITKGRELWTATCRSCHGAAGEGIPGQGKDIRGSQFISDQTDQELVDFIKIGRMPFDPVNTTGIQMPPKGGNPLLDDEDLRDIVTYVRTFKVSGEDGAPADSADGELAQGGDEKRAFWIPRSSIPPPAEPPHGLVLDVPSATGEPRTQARSVHHSVDPRRPANAHIFFGIYFCLTGLHGLHVLAGMTVIVWLIARAARGHFSAAYFTPVDLGALYWHVVDLIWILIFPLLYLIG
ncbi:MAG: cytochrome c oxidase subunit 3 [Planctomycetota bacterium]|nr:cytochrome c oxidase subunit 3 [Planctomycetota bacterium]